MIVISMYFKKNNTFSYFLTGNVYGMWNSYKNLHQREFLGNVKIMKPQEVNMASHDNKDSLKQLRLCDGYSLMVTVMVTV